jgi:hypothetical protein
MQGSAIYWDMNAAVTKFFYRNGPSVHDCGRALWVCARHSDLTAV